MCKYAEFFSAQPLERKIEAKGCSYVIANAWYELEGNANDAKGENEAAFQKKLPILGKGQERLRQNPGEIALSRNEKLVHRHTLIIDKKHKLRHWGIVNQDKFLKAKNEKMDHEKTPQVVTEKLLHVGPGFLYRIVVGRVQRREQNPHLAPHKFF